MQIEQVPIAQRQTNDLIDQGALILLSQESPADSIGSLFQSSRQQLAPAPSLIAPQAVRKGDNLDIQQRAQLLAHLQEKRACSPRSWI
jgi:hypothetical protein